MSKEFLDSMRELTSEFVGMMEYNFYNENEEYRKAYQKESEILNSYKKLRIVWDEKTAIDLTNDEIDALIRLITISDEKARMFSLYMFLQGVKFSHYFLK